MAILNHIEDAEILDTVISCEDLSFYQSVGAYLRGARKPHYSVPALKANADIAITWASISLCQCACCLDNYMDSLESDFPQAFGEF